MMTNELLNHREVLLNDDAIEKYGVKKVFTFHPDVKSAQTFVSAGPEGVGKHLNGVAADVRRLKKHFCKDLEIVRQHVRPNLRLAKCPGGYAEGRSSRTVNAPRDSTPKRS
jgi:hypothetical protein